MSNRKRNKFLGVLALGGHILTIFLLWLLLREDNIQEPVYQKVISAKIINSVPNNFPPLDKAERQKIEKERRQNEESAWAKQQSALKKKYEAEAKKKKEAETKKKLEEKQKADLDKKKLDEQRKKDLDKEKQKKLDTAKREKDEKERRELEEKARKDREKMLEDQRTREATERAKREAYSNRQIVLGKHANSEISNRIRGEWDKFMFSSIQFTDSNDICKVIIKVDRNGKLISARVKKYAKNKNLNSKVAAIIKKISHPSYRFTPFNKSYDKNSISITFDFRAK